MRLFYKRKGGVGEAVNLERTQLVQKKILIAGLPTTGKTYLAREISRQFRCLLYTSKYHEGDRDFMLWNVEKVIIPKTGNWLKEFPLWCVFAKKLAMGNKIDCFIIDDCDLLFPGGALERAPPQLLDLIINHSHYGLTIMFITRRPQDLPTRLYEQAEIHFIFSVEAPNVIDKLNQIYEGYGDMVKSLPYGSHQFVFKHIGQPPQVGRCG